MLEARTEKQSKAKEKKERRGGVEWSEVERSGEGGSISSVAESFSRVDSCEEMDDHRTVGKHVSDIFSINIITHGAVRTQGNMIDCLYTPPSQSPIT